MSQTVTGQTIAVTGHRPKGLPGQYSERTALALSATAKQCIELLTPKCIYTGMALGWDIEVAEAAAFMGVPFVACIPFEGQDYKWPQYSRDRYHKLLGEAEKVVLVSAGRWANWKFQTRNEYMVDRADALLALLRPGATGGTYNCAMYAQEQGKQIYNCYNRFLRNRG